MANLSPWVTIEQLTLDPLNFVNVVVPANCDSVMVYNKAGIDMAIRTDPTDPATENTLLGGTQQIFDSAKGLFSPNVQRFKKGQSIFALKPVSGTGPAILTFLA